MAPSLIPPIPLPHIGGASPTRPEGARLQESAETAEFEADLEEARNTESNLRPGREERPKEAGGGEEQEDTWREDPTRSAAPPPAGPTLGDLLRAPSAREKAARPTGETEGVVGGRDFARAVVLGELEAAARDLPSVLDPPRDLGPPQPTTVETKPISREAPDTRKPPDDASTREASSIEEKKPDGDDAASTLRASAPDRDAGGATVRLPEPSTPSPQLQPAASTQASGDAPWRAVVREGAPAETIAPPPAPAPAPDLEGILRQVRLQVRPGLQDLSIQLDPPELGLLHLRFILEGDQLGVAVLASRPEVAAALRGELRALEETLREAGIALDSLEVGFALDPDGRGPADRSFEEPESPSTVAPFSPRSSRAPRAPAAAPGRLDLFA